MSQTNQVKINRAYRRNFTLLLAAFLIVASLIWLGSGGWQETAAAGSLSEGRENVDSPYQTGSAVINGSISGRVTADLDGSALPGISVLAYASNFDLKDSAVTDANGEYSLTLPPDTYRLEFKDDTSWYIHEYFDDVHTNKYSATPIVVAASTAVSGIDAALTATGRISGKVTVEGTGAPIKNTLVMAYRYNGSDWDPFASVYTDLNGLYTLMNIPEGTYRIWFLAADNVYIYEYYNNAPDIDTATDITVTALSTISDIDAALAENGVISGRVTAEADGTPLNNIRACAWQFEDTHWVFTNKCAYTDVTGNYSIGGMKPDTYRIGFNDFSGAYAGEYYDDAANVDDATDVPFNWNTVAGIDAALAGTGHINGTVTAESDNVPLEGIRVDAYFYRNSRWEPRSAAYTDISGNYDLDSLEAGNYRVGFSDSTGAPPVYVTEFYDNAQDIESGMDVAVSAGGTTTGINAALSEYVRPDNDDIYNATPISTSPFSDMQDVQTASTAVGDPDRLLCAPGKGYGSVWYTLTPAEDILLTVDTFGSNYDTVLTIWHGEPGNLDYDICNDDFDGPQSQLAGVPLAAGTTYYIEVSAYNDNLGTLQLHAQFAVGQPSPPENDDFDNALEILDTPFTFSQNVIVATTAGDDPYLNCGTGDQGLGSVWFVFTPPQNGFIEVGTQGSDYDTVLSIWTGSRGILDFYACNNDSFGAWSNISDLQVTGGTPYYIEVTGNQYLGGDQELHLYFTPIITQDILLSAGWNLISSYVETQGETMQSIVSDIEDVMVLIKNGDGQVYWPAMGTYGLNEWDVHEGYQIFMSQADRLSITGLQVYPSLTAIDLLQGWNLIAYLRDSALPIEQALAAVTGEFVLVKNGDGQIYWPEYGVDQIGTMQPGQGYQVYMQNAGVLTYPDN